jgi:hypothetical protein
MTIGSHGFMDGNCWRISGVRDVVTFFRTIPVLLPEATHLLLEGSPAPGVREVLSSHAEPSEFRAARGTFWSWPQKNQRFTLKASSLLFAALADAARHHAQPEICDHLHLYRQDEPLAQWFDAFVDPFLVSKTVSRERLQEFARLTGGALADSGD